MKKLISLLLIGIFALSLVSALNETELTFEERLKQTTLQEDLKFVRTNVLMLLVLPSLDRFEKIMGRLSDISWKVVKLETDLQKEKQKTCVGKNIPTIYVEVPTPLPQDGAEDVNGDGYFNVVDLDLMNARLNGVADCPLCDINGDGSVDASDKIQLIRRLNGLS